jgi:hypothetical protein
VVREAFNDLLKAWRRSLGLVFVPGHEITPPATERGYVDRAPQHELRVPFSCREAKDAKDGLDEAIAF